MAMDTQYKILFLKNLLESSTERLNISPLHVYKSKIDITGGNLSIEITYNGVATFKKQYENLNVSEMYFTLTKLIEQMLASDILTQTTLQGKGSIKTTIGRI